MVSEPYTRPAIGLSRKSRPRTAAHSPSNVRRFPASRGGFLRSDLADPVSLGGCATEFRRSKDVSRTICFAELLSPCIRSSKMRAAVAPSWYPDCDTEVSAGSVVSPRSRSSKPQIDISLGQLRPNSRIARRVPSAIMSLPAKIAVGRGIKRSRMRVFA